MRDRENNDQKAKIEAMMIQILPLGPEIYMVYWVLTILTEKDVRETLTSGKSQVSVKIGDRGSTLRRVQNTAEHWGHGKGWGKKRVKL